MNYYSIPSKQHITNIQHHISLFISPRAHDFMSTLSIHALFQERYPFQFIITFLSPVCELNLVHYNPPSTAR